MLMNHLMQFLGENKSINRPAVVAWFVRASVFHSVNYAFPQRTVDQTPLVETIPAINMFYMVPTLTDVCYKNE